MLLPRTQARSHADSKQRDPRKTGGVRLRGSRDVGALCMSFLCGSVALLDSHTLFLLADTAATPFKFQIPVQVYQFCCSQGPNSCCRCFLNLATSCASSRRLSVPSGSCSRVFRLLDLSSSAVPSRRRSPCRSDAGRRSGRAFLSQKPCHAQTVKPKTTVCWQFSINLEPP